MQKTGKKPKSVASSNSYVSDSNYVSRELTVSFQTEGNCQDGDWHLYILMLKKVAYSALWRLVENAQFVWDVDASDPVVEASLANEPLVVLLRLSTETQKAENVLQDLQKAAAGNMDLLPLVIGHNCVSKKIDLIHIETRKLVGCSVTVKVEGSSITPAPIAMRVTVLRAACLPSGKKPADNIYVSAVALNNFELIAKKLVYPPAPTLTCELPAISWASLAFLKAAASSDYKIPEVDVFVDPQLKFTDNRDCNAVKWNLTHRILIKETILRERLESPIILEVACQSKSGKAETRGHYMAIVNAAVLLQPKEYEVTLRVPLLKYDKTLIPDNIPPLLELSPPNLYNVPPPLQPNNFEYIFDNNGHMAYIEIHLELTSALTQPVPINELYFLIERGKNESRLVVDNWVPAPSEPKPPTSAKVVKKSCVALSLHKALDDHMSIQTEKNLRAPAIAAQRVLKRSKQLMKEYMADKELFQYHDVVSAQHATVRKVITSSLEPQPHTPHVASPSTITRTRVAGNKWLADSYLSMTPAIDPLHPRPFLSLALRKLELFDTSNAYALLIKSMDKQLNNRFTLWMLGAMENEQEHESKAEAAFRLAIADHSDEGTRKTISWAALHAHYHFNDRIYSSFVAVRDMRKGSKLPIDWKNLLKQWQIDSGEEEYLWDPFTISESNSLTMCAALFLCFRMFKFVERILVCHDNGCERIGTNKAFNSECSDANYIRAASFLIQRRAQTSLKLVDESIRQYGPSCRFSRLRLACLATRKKWDIECEAALEESETLGAPPDPAYLLRSAVFSSDLEAGLQRAARAHQIAPCAQSAIIMSRLLYELGQDLMSERWIIAAVDFEPREPDAWAELARQLLKQQRLKEAHAALRSAKQAGPISQYLQVELDQVSKEVGFKGLPMIIGDELCVCDSAQMFI